MNSTRLLLLGTGAVLLLGVGTAAGYWLASSHLQRPAPEAASESSGATRDAEGRRVLYWYDPMQPQQHFDQPGKSPYMDMPLVAKYADDAQQGGGVRIDSTLMQNIGIRTAPVEMGRLEESIEASGSLTYNDREVTIIQARTGGIVERVYARAPNDWVEAGDALADIRVPEWYGAQAEFLVLNRSADPALVAAARDRLVQLGMSAAVIAELERTRVPQPILTIRFGAGGVLQELGVREGMTVMPGQTLAKVNGLTTVWLEAEVPEAQSGALAVGDPVNATFAAWPERRIAGRVAALLPEVNRDARTVRVRAVLPNPERKLRPGMFARVSIGSPAVRDALIVPSEAVISTGTRSIVIVTQQPGRFMPVEIRAGKERDGRTEVLGGLQQGEVVVTSGQFLIDSEANLKGVLARMDQRAAHGDHETATRYQAQGTVEELNGSEISVAHGPVPALKWGAMTMQFQLGNSSLGTGLKVGDFVRFTFQHQGDEFVIETLQKSGARP